MSVGGGREASYLNFCASHHHCISSVVFVGLEASSLALRTCAHRIFPVQLSGACLQQRNQQVSSFLYPDKSDDPPSLDRKQKARLGRQSCREGHLRFSFSLCRGNLMTSKALRPLQIHTLQKELGNQVPLQLSLKGVGRMVEGAWRRTGSTLMFSCSEPIKSNIAIG